MGNRKFFAMEIGYSYAIVSEKGVAAGLAFGLDNPESRTAVRFANKP